MLRTLVGDLRRWSKGGFINRILRSRRRNSLQTPDVESLELDRTQCQEPPRVETSDPAPVSGYGHLRNMT